MAVALFPKARYYRSLTTMSTKDLEELVTTLRQFAQKARSQNDTFEYCRLCDEVRFAEAALKQATLKLVSNVATAPQLALI